VSPNTAGDAARARRIENATARVLERTGRLEAGGAESLEVAGGRAVWLGPGSPASAALGLGLAGEIEAGDLDRVEVHLGRQGGEVRVDLAAPADGSLSAELGARGYAVRDFQLVWVGRPARPGADPGDGVRPVRPGEEETWAALVAEAWLGIAPAGTTGQDPAWSRRPAEGQEAFLAFRDGIAVGAALASVVDGLALLSGAGVRPSHRGRGLHGALLAARLEWARDRGCDLVAACTRPAAPSQRNLERAGFRCAYPKAVLVGRARGGRPWA
jgi:GNAT superfamily N-acetyltransferase